MAYQLVIFDFDGTLADSLPWLLSVINNVADRYGFKRVETGERESLRGFTPAQIISHLGVPKWKLPVIARHVRKLASGHLRQIPLFDGIGRLLKRLADRGIILGVVTSNAYDNVCRVLGPRNSALITYYECGVSVFGKPGNLRKILKKSGIPPAKAILIGDEIRDCQAARKVKMAFGAVSWGYNNLKALQSLRPDRVFTTVPEIAKLIA